MEVPSFHTGCLPWFLFSWLRVSCTRELCCSSGLVQCHKYLVRTYSAAGFLNLSAIDILTLSNSLLCNAVLCIVGCLAAPLASTHQMLIVFPNLPHPPFSLHNVYRHCPMSSGVKLLLLENHWESPSPLQITPPWVTLFWVPNLYPVGISFVLCKATWTQCSFCKVQGEIINIWS